MAANDLILNILQLNTKFKLKIHFAKTATNLTFFIVTNFKKKKML